MSLWRRGVIRPDDYLIVVIVVTVVKLHLAPYVEDWARCPAACEEVRYSCGGRTPVYEWTEEAWTCPTPNKLKYFHWRRRTA